MTAQVVGYDLFDGGKRSAGCELHLPNACIWGGSLGLVLGRKPSCAMAGKIATAPDLTKPRSLEAKLSLSPTCRILNYNAGLPAHYSPHSFWATGVTLYLNRRQPRFLLLSSEVVQQSTI